MLSITVLERELQIGLEIFMLRKGHKVVLQIFLAVDN